METSAIAARKGHIGQGPKFLLDFGPLLVFFVVNGAFGLVPATAALMAAIVLSLIYTWLKARKLAPVPLVSGLLVLVFGGLTVAFDDDFFIKIKPTIVNAMFSLVLLGGLMMKKPLIKLLLGTMLPLTDDAWLKLSLRWGVFFAGMAVLNELVWRNFSTDVWVSFKVFGFLPLSIVFGMAQVPLINRSLLPAKRDKAGRPAE